MAKNQPVKKSSETKPPSEMIHEMTMASSVHQVPPHMMLDIRSVPQQVTADLATLASVSQEDLDLLLSCLTQIACYPYGYATEPTECAGNIPMIDQLIEMPQADIRKSEDPDQEQRETTTSGDGGQGYMSEEDMVQAIEEIITGEPVSPVSRTSAVSPVSQTSSLSQSYGSGPPRPHLEGQDFFSKDQGHFTSCQSSDIAAGHPAGQVLLPIGQGCPVSDPHSSFRDGQMSLSVGHGSHPISGFPSFIGTRMDNPDFRRIMQGPTYPQGSGPLPPHCMPDYSHDAGATSQEGQPRLWKFILDLLENPQYNPSLITWVSRPEGIFRLMDPPRLAEFWGHVKGNKSMNYEKLSRGLRYYYNHQVLEHVPGKLVYKFGPTAQVWQYLAQTSHGLPPTTASSTVTSQYSQHTSQ